MKIQSMFQKDINRDINGVVKVAQDDEKSLHQELSEYIITKELRRHFRTFFDNYTKAIDQPTDKMGVWISGFFGSGKSHFLKMLSYLLSNKEVQGVPAIDYFKDKFDDPMMYAQAVKCVSIPTESILFNIDIEGPINKDTLIFQSEFPKESETQKQMDDINRAIENQSLYQCIQEKAKKILDLSNPFEEQMYYDLMNMAKMRCCTPYVSPEDYDRMVRFTESAIADDKWDIINKFLQLGNRALSKQDMEKN